MATYKIYGENIEQGALDQFHSALDQPYVVKAALMPDAHLGYSLPIGAVVATEGVVVPSWVGYDIGCGMCAAPTTFSVDQVLESRRDIFSALSRKIPVGNQKHRRQQIWSDEEFLRHSKIVKEMYAKRNAAKQLGTLGGGNHFIEIGVDETDKVWIIIHSGSRGLGHGVAGAYMKLACGEDKAKEGHYGLQVATPLGQDYIMDLNYCLEYALLNRRRMLVAIEETLQLGMEGAIDWPNMINRNHNHAEFKDGLWIHRKGATHAEEGMMGVIPGNMRDGSFIVEGKGNPDSLWSSSHGAGRVLGRGAAKRSLSEAEFVETMKDVTCNAGASTLDESPMAYKDIYEVMALQDDLVEVKHHVTPIVNIKG